MKNKEPIISGIQQVGIGVTNVSKAWAWYRKHFGMNIRVFEDEAEAKLMTKYTGGEVHKRHAALAINPQGGGGMEIWQFVSRTGQPPIEPIALGDLGMNCVKIKSRNVQKSYDELQSLDADILTSPEDGPNGEKSFFLRDNDGNLFQMVESNSWFRKTNMHSGGPSGAIIGVTDIEQSKAFYANILGYNEVEAEV